MPEPANQATVVITTKNRREDLRNALASALTQDARPQVLVIDDGSSDGTNEMIRAEFPTVIVDRSESSRGLIVQRNRAATLTTTPIIFSIDDDASFSSPKIVSQTLAEFENPRVGAVAIPFINLRQDNIVRQKAPDAQNVYITACYIGTAHALRRDIFQRLSGYREFLFHQGEEDDYCARMLEAGYVVRLGLSDPIHHFESPRRDFRRMDLYGRRNNILYAWHNVPMPYLPAHLMGTTVNGMKLGFQLRRPMRMAHGLSLGYLALLRQLTKRKPISKKIYRLTRMLRKKGAMNLSEIEPLLPTISNLKSKI